MPQSKRDAVGLPPIEMCNNCSNTKEKCREMGACPHCDACYYCREVDSVGSTRRDGPIYCTVCKEKVGYWDPD